MGGLVRTYRLVDNADRVVGFEIENAYVGLRTVRLLLEGAGADSFRTLWFRLREEGVHLSFRHGGIEWVVWEPFGDSSRYVVGPRHDPLPSEDHIQQLEAVFQRHEPGLLRRLVGDLITLKFLKRVF